MYDLQTIKYMNDKAHIKYVLKVVKNTTGATLSGDDTLDIKDYKNGYQVSVKDVYSVPINGLTAHVLLVDYLYPMVRNNTMNYDIGLWLDEEGILWIDYSINIKDREEALSVAKSYDQKAIFDWANKDEIRLKKYR